MADLIIHFLNVGQGDCTIVEFPSGRVGIVDIDNLKALDPDTKKELLEEYHASLQYQIGLLAGRQQQQLDKEFLAAEEKKLTDPLAYYDANIKTNHIFRFLITHPDMDHMTGIHRIHAQDSTKTIGNFWHTGRHDFNLADTESDEWFRYDQRDWETYKQLRDGKIQGVTSLQKYQGATGEFWTEDGLELWAPTPDLEKLAVEQEKSNVLSMVVKISYAGRSIVLGGDATAEETWPAIYPGLKMSGISVLKASHHGRKSGYYGPAVKEMNPWLTITSVGEREHDATENYRRYSKHTVSLRKSGDIKITVKPDGKWYYSGDLENYWKDQKTD
jgi:beta-lactamase superfamily II metal-dependent hydrolase